MPLYFNLYLLYSASRSVILESTVAIASSNEVPVSMELYASPMISCTSAYPGNVEYGIEQVDVMVLFGGSILCGGDILAQAMRNQIAKKYIIVGGAGHTTETLRQLVHREYPQIVTENLPEAEVFSCYLKEVYQLEADALETRSSNCGNNITNLIALLEEKNITWKSIILCQDATMQHRMEAGLHKYASEKLIINYASYQAKVCYQEAELQYQIQIHGMWKIDRYINLLMGEIPRLTDNAEGYGPNGKKFICHVDIPENVREAFELLKTVYGEETRAANPLYA